MTKARQVLMIVLVLAGACDAVGVSDPTGTMPDGAGGSSGAEQASSDGSSSGSEAAAKAGPKPNSASVAKLGEALKACNDVGDSGTVEEVDANTARYRKLVDEAKAADRNIATYSDFVELADKNSIVPAQSLKECDERVTYVRQERVNRAQANAEEQAKIDRLKGDRKKIWEENGEPSDYEGEDPAKSASWTYQYNVTDELEACTFVYRFRGNRLASSAKRGLGCGSMQGHSRVN
jgi:hypothetical protein